MNETNEKMREKLLAAVEEDGRVRAELAKTGELFDGYNKQMEAVHLKNARLLEQMIDEAGGAWLGKLTVGEDGANAAWLIVQHAISLPEFSRRCLKLIEAAVETGDADAAHAAYLEDRINFFERKPQRFGTQSDWGADGKMHVWDLVDEEHVNDLRVQVGLAPLESLIWENEETADNAPKDYAARQKDAEKWLKSVGWIQ